METPKVLELAATPSPSFFSAIPPPFEHQRFTTQFYLDNQRVFDMSDPGTGKTRAALDAIVKLKSQGLGRTLILAPKAILNPAWGNDIRKFTPELSYSIAAAPKRQQAFETNTDIVLTNHDAAVWLADNAKLLSGFDLIIMDEITAYKHRESARSQAMQEVVKHFERRAGLTGTPIANGLLHIWHQAYLIDGGQSLGSHFFRFRSAVCFPEQNGLRVEWTEKPGARDAVADALSPITVRHNFEECTDIPPNTERSVPFTLSPKHQAAYQKLLRQSLIEADGKIISAVHAAALTSKLLQLCAGSVYDDTGAATLIASDRYELVMELAEEREQCVIAFQWKHQRDALIKEAIKRKFSFAVIDGDTDARRVPQIVSDFQEGSLKLILAQPQSAAHGLTLTRGTATIWASPTSDAERYLQFNRRIYRAGQTKKTETLVVIATGTLEERVFYDVLTGRVNDLVELLALLKTDLKEAA